jgi:sugar phosphate isomerase/epimerase
MAQLTACSTLAFSLSSLEIALKHISQYGFQYVEIAEMLTHSKHFPIDSVDPAEVQSLLRQYGLTPIGANVTLATLSSGESDLPTASALGQASAETDAIKAAKRNRVCYRLQLEKEADQYLQRARHLIDQARLAGIPMLVLNVGRKEHARDIDHEIEASAAVLDTAAEYARAAGIKIVLEMPHVWQLYYDLRRSQQMLSHLKSDNIGVLIDSTHWHVSGYNIDEYVRFLGDRLWHVHLRDAAGKDSSGGQYQLEITPGEGEVDFRLLGETLDRHQYHRAVTLETEYKNYHDPSQVDHANRMAFAHLQSAGWTLKNAS